MAREKRINSYHVFAMFSAPRTRNKRARFSANMNRRSDIRDRDGPQSASLHVICNLTNSAGNCGVRHTWNSDRPTRTLR